MGSNSALFSGGNVELGNDSSLKVDNISFSFWIKSNTDTWNHTIYNSRANIATYGGVNLSLYNTEINLISSGDGSSWNISLISNDTITVADGWVHVVVVRSNGDSRIHINNVQQSSTSSYSGSVANYSSIMLGNTTALGYPADAYLDEFCIWNRALTIGEVSTLYNGGDGLEVSVITTINKPTIHVFN